MNKNYLLVLASYIDNDSKRDIVVDTLKCLKEENVDVCLVMHSNKYTDDIIPYVKYMYYDNDNEYITLESFSEYHELLNDENCSKGKNKLDRPVANWLAGNNWYVLDYSKPEYTKSALSLIRNGNLIAYSQNYEWTIYLEWDIPVPIGGYKKLIEEKILLLKSENKKCFYYEFDKYEIKLKWPGIIIFDSKELYNSDIINNNWHTSTYNWIKYWGNTSFEYCVNHLIDNTFGNNVIVRSISDECETLWGITNYIDLSRSYNLHNRDTSNFILKICPKKIDDIYELYLIMFSPIDNTNAEILNLQVYYDEKNIINYKKFRINPGGWYLEKLPNIENVESVKLLYQLDNKSSQKQQTLLSKSIDKMYKYIINLNSF